MNQRLGMEGSAWRVANVGYLSMSQMRNTVQHRCCSPSGVRGASAAQWVSEPSEVRDLYRGPEFELLRAPEAPRTSFLLSPFLLF